MHGFWLSWAKHPWGKHINSLMLNFLCWKLANRQEQQHNTSKSCPLGAQDYWVEWEVGSLSRSVKRNADIVCFFYHLSFLFLSSYCFTLNVQQNATTTMKPLLIVGGNFNLLICAFKEYLFFYMFTEGYHILIVSLELSLKLPFSTGWMLRQDPWNLS